MLGFVPSPTLDLSSPSKARSRGPSHRPSLSGPAASTTTSSITEITISPLTRTTIAQEYASLVYTGHCPLGMYVTPTPNNLLVWDAVFFVHQGASPKLYFLVCHAKLLLRADGSQATTRTRSSSSGSPSLPITLSDRLWCSSSPMCSIL